MPKPIRLLVVNPNTTRSMTEKIGAAARAVAAPKTEIAAVSPGMGPASIEGYYDEAFAVPGLIEEVRKGEAGGCDGYVVACFDDTGVDAARCIARGPVLGIAEGCGGVKLVEAVVGPGLGTSKAIGYAPPLPKRHNGDLVRFAP